VKIKDKLTPVRAFGPVASAAEEPARDGRQRTIGLRYVWRLGARLAVKEWASGRTVLRRCLSVARHPSYPITWLSPIRYKHYREFAFVFESIARYRPSPGALLDISSPKLLPVTIASARPEMRVDSIDILESDVLWVRKAMTHLGLPNLTASVADARTLPFDDESFDLVTSVSVFEHIAPENGGEAPAARELGRVLAPGGIALLTVPFSQTYFAEYRVGTVYERASTDGQPIFYQRFYDMNLLKRNLVAASGLRLVSIDFIEERFFSRDPHTRLASYIVGTRRQRLVFGLLYPLLARVFLSKPKELKKCKKPYIACLVLRKP
jgi:SAM-dependent methyltransferase